MRKIKAMIAEDERLAREELMYLLEQEKDIVLLPSAANGRELFELIKLHEPHVIFLDIQMPELDGIQAARMLRSRMEDLIIVFTTAHDDFALDAFELNAADYLMKPYSYMRLKESLGRIRQKLAERSDGGARSSSADKLSKLLIDDGERLVVIDPEIVLYAEREEKVIHLYTTDHQCFTSKYTLSELGEKLAGYPFFRPHRSYLVNLNHIDELVPWFNGAYNVILKGEKRTQIPVSRESAKELFRLLNRS